MYTHVYTEQIRSKLASAKYYLDSEYNPHKAAVKVKEAKDAEPAKPEYWELNRGALINEVNKRGIEIKGLNTKGVYISKEQLINYLENDDK